MRRFVPLFALLLATTACGGGGDQERRSAEDLKTFDAREEGSVDTDMRSRPAFPADASAPPQPPGISPAAAPGVAFNYRYAFRLAGARIAAVQEQHAAACEKLGLDRCRITGMRYRLVDDEDVEAMLAFKLDPAIARSFGKAGVELVMQAEGMLVDSAISGVDAGADIEAATRSEGQLAEELRRVEAQLAGGGLGSAERAELQIQADRLRQSIRAARSTRTESRESLAKTPMVFNYGSGDVVPGFDDRSPIRTALKEAWDNFIAGVAAMLLIGLTLLPWAGLLLLLIWLYRRFFRGSVDRLGITPGPSREEAVA